MGNFVSGLLILATVVLAVLKVAGVIAWPWLAVLLPGIVAVGFIVVGLLFVLAAAIAAGLFSRK